MKVEMKDLANLRCLIDQIGEGTVKAFGQKQAALSWVDGLICHGSLQGDESCVECGFRL